jgi:hypothetical protein
VAQRPGLDYDLAFEALVVERRSTVRRALGEAARRLTDAAISRDDAAAEIVGVVERFGLRPAAPPLAPEPITIDDLRVVCWMAVLGGRAAPCAPDLKRQVAPGQIVWTAIASLDVRRAPTFGRTYPHADTFADTPRISPLWSILLITRRPRLSGAFADAGGGIRTPDTRIMIPLL